jgi:LPXTG-site transpeptidase (sortase) family protein
VWTGLLGPDFGVTDPAAAINEIRISFNVRVDDGTNSVTNTATIDVDRNGDGDTNDAGEIQVANAAAGWSRPSEPGQTDSSSLPAGLPATGFAPGRVTGLPAQPKELAYTNSGDMTLEIPAIGVNTAVVGVPLTDAGWQLDWLGSQAGYLEGTAFPTWNGNSVLTAHVYDADGNPGPFVDLSKMRWGQKIIIHAWGQTYTFEVRSVRTRVSPTDASVLKHETRPWLTLITCQGYDQKSDTYRWRVVVKAVLVSIE